MTDEQRQLLRALKRVAARMRRVEQDQQTRDELILRGRELGVPTATLAAAAGVQPVTVRWVYMKHARKDLGVDG